MGLRKPTQTDSGGRETSHVLPACITALHKSGNSLSLAVTTDTLQGEGLQPALLG